MEDKIIETRTKIRVWQMLRWKVEKEEAKTAEKRSTTKTVSTLQKHSEERSRKRENLAFGNLAERRALRNLEWKGLVNPVKRELSSAQYFSPLENVPLELLNLYYNTHSRHSTEEKNKYLTFTTVGYWGLTETSFHRSLDRTPTKKRIKGIIEEKLPVLILSSWKSLSTLRDGI